MGGRKPEQARTSKSVKNLRKINVVCLLGLSWRASWSSLGSLLGSFGASWCLLGRLGGLLARLTPSEAVLGASLGRRSAFWKRFRLVLGSSWESLGRSWGPLGPICGRLGSLMGCLGAILEASRAVLGGRTPQQARTSQSFKNLKKINVALLPRALLEGLLELSWAVLGASWAVLRPSGEPLELS